MSGEETLAQVNREIEHPKLKNLEKTGLVIFIYSLLFTSLVSFFAVMIIPDKVRPDYFANLIGGIAMYLVGPESLKLLFHGFVVLVGVLILAGAQNTSIVGANGVLNRVAEDGVLTSWFQKPHNRYGTSYRIINLIVGLQLLTIVLSRGNVYMLAALYAFGVIWSFAMKSIAVLVLRFTEPGNRDWKVPGNLHIGKTEVPVGLILISAVLLITAVVNLFTKYQATIAGVIFSAVFFTIFTLSEHHVTKERHGKPEQLDQFRVYGNQELGSGAMGVRAGKHSGRGARSPQSLLPAPGAGPYQHGQAGCGRDERAPLPSRAQLQRQLGHGSQPGLRPLRAGTLHRRRGRRRKRGQADFAAGGPGNRRVRSHHGDRAAARFRPRRSAASRTSSPPTSRPSSPATPGSACPSRVRACALEVAAPDGTVREYTIGPHTPRLRPQDVELMHKLWLNITTDPKFAGAHHYHIVALALEELQRELSTEQRAQLLQKLQEEMNRSGEEPRN